MSMSGRPGSPIQALVLGPGNIGLSVIAQLDKNSRFSVTLAGPGVQDTEDEARQYDCLVRTVDLEKATSPLTLNDLIDDLEPDIVFLCQRGSEWDVENMIASSNLERSMLDESLRIGEAPIISVSLEQEQSPDAPP